MNQDELVGWLMLATTNKVISQDVTVEQAIEEVMKEYNCESRFTESDIQSYKERAKKIDKNKLERIVRETNDL